MTAAGTTSSVLEPPSNWHTESVLTPSTGIIHYQIRYPAGDAAFIMMCREAGGADPGQGQPGPCPGSAGQVVRGPLPGQQRPSDSVDPLDRRARLRRRRQRGLHGRTDPGSQPKPDARGVHPGLQRRHLHGPAGHPGVHLGPRVAQGAVQGLDQVSTLSDAGGESFEPNVPATRSRPNSLGTSRQMSEDGTFDISPVGHGLQTGWKVAVCLDPGLSLLTKRAFCQKSGRYRDIATSDYSLLANWRFMTELLTLVANSLAIPSGVQDNWLDGIPGAQIPSRKALEPASIAN